MQVPPFLVRKVFTQIFSFINVQLFNRLVCSALLISRFKGRLLFCRLEESHFNHLIFFCSSLLLRRECCSFSNGEYVKAGLAELEHWCYKATDEVH